MVDSHVQYRLGNVDAFQVTGINQIGPSVQLFALCHTHTHLCRATQPSLGTWKVLHSFLMGTIAHDSCAADLNGSSAHVVGKEEHCELFQCMVPIGVVGRSFHVWEMLTTLQRSP